MKSPTSVPVPGHELGHDTMDDSVGWAKLIAAFAHQAEITDKEESRKYLSELDYPKEFAKCYRLGEATEAQPIPRQLLEHGWRFIYTKNVSDCAMKEAVLIDDLKGFEIAYNTDLLVEKQEG